MPDLFQQIEASILALRDHTGSVAALLGIPNLRLLQSHYQFQDSLSVVG
jgi:hypothetical protein